VWIDDGGTTDATDTSAHDGEMEIAVDGHSYTAAENMDLNHDGVDDTVRMDNSDGTITAYVDTDGDGHADEYIHTDAAGNVTEEAHFDAATGQWVAGHDEPTSGHSTDTAHGGDITADTKDGTIDVGPATVDSNNDGTADTAVVTDAQGNTVLYTDTDGDGKADAETVITPTGETHTYDHTGPGTWTETATAAPDSDHFWSGAGHDTVEGVAKIDSGTGQWISQN